MLIKMYSVKGQHSFGRQLECKTDFGFSAQIPRASHGYTLFTAACMIKSEGYYPNEVTDMQFSDKTDVYSYRMVGAVNTKFNIIKITYQGCV